MLTKQQFEEYIKYKIKTSSNIFEGTPCFEWQRAISKQGYAVANIERKTVLIHRLILFYANNTMPFQTDHRCFNRKCLNILHLEDVTPKENSIRMGKRRIEVKTHCEKGHLLADPNILYTTEKGKLRRRCKQCRHGYINVYQPVYRLFNS